MRRGRFIRYYPRFPEAVPGRGAGCPRVTQPFATASPTEVGPAVRLACVRRAASVHPEPGSNSPFGAPRFARRDSPMRRMSGSHSKTTLISDFTGIDSAPCHRARHSSIASLSFVVRSLGHGIRFSGCPAASVRVGGAPREEVIYAPRRPGGRGSARLHGSCTFGLRRRRGPCRRRRPGGGRARPRWGPRNRP